MDGVLVALALAVVGIAAEQGVKLIGGGEQRAATGDDRAALEAGRGSGWRAGQQWIYKRRAARGEYQGVSGCGVTRRVVISERRSRGMYAGILESNARA